MPLAHRADASVSFVVVRGGDVLVGRNVRAEYGRGVVLVNRRGVRYAGDEVYANGVARPFLGAAWTSTFGSVTFNIHGAGFPIGGMNERGLVVEALQMDSVVGFHPTIRSTLRPLAWVQRLLDDCATVSDVIRYASTTTNADGMPYHFHVADSTGASTVIEFSRGRTVLLTGAELPVSVLAGDPYTTSLARARGSLITGDDDGGAGVAAWERFDRVASLVRDAPAEGGQRNLIEFALHILGSVAVQTGTRWSALYDIRLRRIYFRSPTRMNVKRIDVSKVDFRCADAAVALDVEQRPKGDVSNRFAPYTADWNWRQLTESLPDGRRSLSAEMAEIESLAGAANIGPCVGGN